MHRRPAVRASAFAGSDSRSVPACFGDHFIKLAGQSHSAGLQECFGSWGYRVIGTTRRIDAAGSLPANRFRECQMRAEEVGVSNWVMVDDQPGIVWGSQIPTRELVRMVIWCDPVLGLATPLVASAIVTRFLVGDFRRG